MTDSIFIHKNSIVEPGAKIGERTRIWAFAHILSGALIGQDCNICDGVFVENDVLIGDRVIIKNGAQLLDGVSLEDDVFVGPNATFTNRFFSIGGDGREKTPKTIVYKGASIGANATILPGIQIGTHAMVEAGAVVTRDVPAYAVVAGNPASIHGYVSTTNGKAIQPQVTAETMDVLSISRAKLINLPCIVDLRGTLSFGEYDRHLPFTPKRYFVIFDVPTVEVRGEHAHREQHQFLVCLKGSCAIVLDDGRNREELILNQPNIGLHIPSMVWAVEYKFTQEAILLVLASDIYDEKDYIRDYDLYLRTIKRVNDDD